MRIVSFNTQHCLDYLNQVIDFQLFADTIVSLKADVVGLNEMRGAGIHPEYTDQTKALSDRSGILKNGRLLATGTVDALQERTGAKNFEEAFVTLVKEDAP